MTLSGHLPRHILQKMSLWQSHDLIMSFTHTHVIMTLPWHYYVIYTHMLLWHYHDLIMSFTHIHVIITLPWHLLCHLRTHMSVWHYPCCLYFTFNLLGWTAEVRCSAFNWNGLLLYSSDLYPNLGETNVEGRRSQIIYMSLSWPILIHQLLLSRHISIYHRGPAKLMVISDSMAINQSQPLYSY